MCHHHHQLVHEGGWQVIKVGNGFDFIPPEHLRHVLVRGPAPGWAA